MKVRIKLVIIQSLHNTCQIGQSNVKDWMVQILCGGSDVSDLKVP